MHAPRPLRGVAPVDQSKKDPQLVVQAAQVQAPVASSRLHGHATRGDHGVNRRAHLLPPRSCLHACQHAAFGVVVRHNGRAEQGHQLHRGKPLRLAKVLQGAHIELLRESLRRHAAQGQFHDPLSSQFESVKKRTVLALVVTRER